MPAVIGQSLERTARMCDDPAPLVVLRQFGSSGIDFDIYYWHASDVPAELSAQVAGEVFTEHAAVPAGRQRATTASPSSSWRPWRR